MFVDREYQSDGPTFPRGHPEYFQFRGLDYKSQRLAIGLAWTIAGPRHAGIDL